MCLLIFIAIVPHLTLSLLICLKYYQIHRPIRQFVVEAVLCYLIHKAPQEFLNFDSKLLVLNLCQGFKTENDL